MPELDSGDLLLLRQQPIRRPKGRFISVGERETVYSGQIATLSTDIASGGHTAAYLTASSGTYSDIEADMSADFGSSAGARDLGTLRARTINIVSPWVGFTETAPALLPIAIADWLTVKREYRPWVKIPYGVGQAVGTPYTNTLTLYMDYTEAYVNQNVNILPKANITRSASLPFAPKPAGFVDDGQSYRTVVLSSAYSVAIAHGASISSVEWDVRDGTISSGTSTSTTITVQFPVGFRYVVLTVTDSNGSVGTIRYPIWSHDTSYMPLTNFMPTRNSTSEWREMEFEFFEQDTDELVIPQGVPICYWEIADFAGESTPDAYRDQFFGWCSEDTTLFRRYVPRNTLVVTGLGGWLSRFRGFSQRISDKGTTPASWFEMDHITLNRVAYYLLLNFTSVTGIANMYFHNDTTELKSLDITLGNVWQQLQYILSGNYTSAKTDSLNSIWIRKEYSHLTLAERASVDAIANLTRNDWLDSNALTMPRRHYHVIGSLSGPGASFDGSDNTLLNSRAPGKTPGDSEATQEAPFQNLPNTDSQDTLNALTGLHFAFLNNQRIGVQLELLYDMDAIEPAWQEPITISTDDSRSGLVLDEDEFTVKTVEVTYNDPGAGRGKVVRLTLDGVTHGEPGQTVIVPIDQTIPTDWEPPTDIIVPPVPGPTQRLPLWSGTDQVPTKMVGCSYYGPEASRASLWNPSTGAVTWVDISTGLTGNCRWMTADPYDYRRYFILTTTGLYRCNDVWAASPSWSLVSNNASLFGDAGRVGHYVVMSINRKGWIMALSGYTGAAVTFNYGASWTQVSIIGGSPNWTTSNQSQLGAVAVSPFNSGDEGWLYTTHWVGSGDHRICRSTNWGLTYSLRSSGNLFNIVGTPRIALPYKKAGGVDDNINDATQVILLQGRLDGNRGDLRRSTNAASTWGLVWGPNASGTPIPPRPITGPTLVPFTWDANILLQSIHWAGAPGGAGGALRVSGNGGSSGTVSAKLATGAEDLGLVNGFPSHSQAALWWNIGGSTGELKWTLNGGSTIVDGTMPSFFTGTQKYFANVQWDLSDFVAPA